MPRPACARARKLIDVDKVQAIMSVWASAVGTAVLPLCWENKVMLLGISAADLLALLPHQGYFVRTQPHTELQGKEFGRFILAQGAKSVYLIMPQTPFTETVFKAIRETVEPKGVKVASAIIDNKKTSFRSEIDEMVRANPDIFMMGGYLAENIVMAKDLFRANFKGKVMGFAYGITPAFIDGAGKEAAEGIFSIADPSPAFDSPAYAKLKALVKRDVLDTFICQAYDHANLAILSMAKGKDATGTAIRDNIRKIANNDARHEGRQRARRPEGDRRRQGDQVFRRLRPVQVLRHRQHHRGRVPHRAGEGRQAGRGEGCSRRRAAACPPPPCGRGVRGGGPAEWVRADRTIAHPPPQPSPHRGREHTSRLIGLEKPSSSP